MRSILKNKDTILDKALTILVIENTLLEVGNSTYEYVVDMFNKEYHRGFTDCYEHPEYLSVILKKLFGSSSNDIIESIKKQLEQFSNKKPIARFVNGLSQ